MGEVGQHFAFSHDYHRSVSTEGFSWSFLSTWHCGLLQVPKQKGRVMLARTQRAPAKPNTFVTIDWNEENSDSLC